RESGEVGLSIEMVPGETDLEGVLKAKEMLVEFPGPAAVIVVWRPVAPAANGAAENGHPVLRSRSLKVAPRRELLVQLREVFGEQRVRLVRQEVNPAALTRAAAR